MRYIIRKQLLYKLTPYIDIYAENEQLVCHVTRKVLKLYEEITGYRDRAGQSLVFRMKAKTAMDFKGVYDIFDAQDKHIATLKKEWAAGAKTGRAQISILDPSGAKVGFIIFKQYFDKKTSKEQLHTMLHGGLEITYMDKLVGRSYFDFGKLVKSLPKLKFTECIDLADEGVPEELVYAFCSLDYLYGR